MAKGQGVELVLPQGHERHGRESNGPQCKTAQRTRLVQRHAIAYVVLVLEDERSHVPASIRFSAVRIKSKPPSNKTTYRNVPAARLTKNPRSMRTASSSLVLMRMPPAMPKGVMQANSSISHTIVFLESVDLMYAEAITKDSTPLCTTIASRMENISLTFCSDPSPSPSNTEWTDTTSCRDRAMNSTRVSAWWCDVDASLSSGLPSCVHVCSCPGICVCTPGACVCTTNLLSLSSLENLDAT